MPAIHPNHLDGLGDARLILYYMDNVVFSKWFIKIIELIFHRLETIDGSATAGEDYIPVKQTLVFKPEQTYIEYVVEIIDDNVYEPDETFFVKLQLEPDQTAVMGKKSINMITIINDDGE